MSKMESTAEKYLDSEIRKLGGDTVKCVGRKFMPDRMVRCRGKLIFVEMKALGEKPTKGQMREINRINEMYKNTDAISATRIEGRAGVDEFIKQEFTK